MKIFHLWNTAGVGGYIARFMDRYHGTESTVIMRKPQDAFDVTVGFGEVYDEKAAFFMLRGLLRARHFDIIHVHSLDVALPFLKLLYPKKSLIIHYHGTKVRGCWPSREKYWRHADKILVSTPDLLEGAPKGTFYIPNIINEDRFHPGPPEDVIKGMALHVDLFARDVAMVYAVNNGLVLIVHDRVRNPLPQEDFASLLRRFEWYIDVKRDYVEHKRILPAMSLTGFEALASGCKVIRWDGEILEELPEIHSAKYVTGTLKALYLHLLLLKQGVEDLNHEAFTS